ncbi:MAG TPA: GMC family oxidoreductase [Longimicrobium sp.]|jgi:cholesterol oxidase
MSTDHFDVVIVGSGFGGSVMAYRLAEAGVRVCVLERGKPFPPGSFPRDPAGMKQNFWDPSAGLYGMFNVWSFRHIDSLVSAGLGGGSLIYANVLLRKDEKWFVREQPGKPGWEYWMVTRQDLDPHYDQVERMMNAQRYPLGYEPYASTPKTLAMREAAEALRARGETVSWDLVDLAVTFHNDGEEPIPGEPIVEAHRNLHNRTRYTCRLCGECDAGCNYGSKNTLDYTYLSEAKRLGAEIRTLSDVRAFFPNGRGGYTVRYDELTIGEPRGPDTPRRTLDCDRLVIAAGTLGSTHLLLNNRAFFPRLSPALGTHFCGNGDLLGFALNAHRTVGGKKVPRTLDPSFGPVITGAIRMGDALDGPPNTGRGFYLEDAGYPSFLNWILETANRAGLLARGVGFAWDRLKSRFGIDPDTDLGDELSGMLGPCTLSSTSLPLLGMGRDVPDGRLFLDEECLQSDWKIKESDPYFERLRETMEKVAGEWGAAFLDNPIWHLGKRVISVHPLGGCPMGRNEQEGVVDAWGEVYNYPGLYVADGAVMPGPTGANPSLTIGAMSNRFADRMIEQYYTAKVAVPKVVAETGVIAEAPSVEAGSVDDGGAPLV